ARHHEPLSRSGGLTVWNAAACGGTLHLEEQQMSSTINTMLIEKRVLNPSKEFVANARISGMDQYRAMYEEAERNPDTFWRTLAQENLFWRKPFTKVLDDSNAPFYTWFEDGELNVSENCLDVHVKNGNG